MIDPRIVTLLRLENASTVSKLNLLADELHRLKLGHVLDVLYICDCVPCQLPHFFLQ